MRTMLAIARALRKRQTAMSENPAATALSCPLWRRLLALVYDLLIVTALIMVVGLVCEKLTGGMLVSTDSSGHAHIAWWYRPLQALVVSEYFIASWRRGGQTLGMRPWRIRVCREDGGTISIWQAVIRVLVAAAPLQLLMLEPWLGLHTTLWTLLLVWAGWFAVALFDPRRRALHDVLARTEVRRLD
jgi:uncharacterized RDD family membrane protein YckC